MVESAIKRFEEAQTSSNVPCHAGLGLSSTLGSFSNAWGALPNGGLSACCADFGESCPQAPDDPTAWSELREEMNKMTSKYKNLENCFKVNSVTIEGITFGSYNIVEDFVRKNNPSGNADGFTISLLFWKGLYPVLQNEATI